VFGLTRALSFLNVWLVEEGIEDKNRGWRAEATKFVINFARDEDSGLPPTRPLVTWIRHRGFAIADLPSVIVACLDPVAVAQLVTVKARTELGIAQ
jgi:hypothetical protein